MYLVGKTEDDVYKLTRNNFKDIQSSDKAKNKRVSIICYLSCKKKREVRIQVTFLTKKQTRTDKPEINEDYCYLQEVSGNEVETVSRRQKVIFLLNIPLCIVLSFGVMLTIHILGRTCTPRKRGKA